MPKCEVCNKNRKKLDECGVCDKCIGEYALMNGLIHFSAILFLLGSYVVKEIAALQGKKDGKTDKGETVPVQTTEETSSEG